jgi:REP element-mobilizing transposase RayT
MTSSERDLVKAALLHFEKSRFLLSVFVVMDDHVHLLVQPLETWKLESLVQSWKRFTSLEMVRKFNRKAPIWQDEYMDRIIRNEMEFNEKANYILTNPMRRWPEIQDYPWVGIVE